MIWWLRIDMVLVFHFYQLQTYGGAPGVRDRAALESALARPQHRESYDPKADVFDLASDYGYGIAQNHPFVDGNKRVAFVSVAVFLHENGWLIDAEELEVVLLMRAVAGGEVSRADLAEWLRKACVARPTDG